MWEIYFAYGVAGDNIIKGKVRQDVRSNVAEALSCGLLCIGPSTFLSWYQVPVSLSLLIEDFVDKHAYKRDDYYVAEKYITHTICQIIQCTFAPFAVHFVGIRTTVWIVTYRAGEISRIVHFHK
jgi:hypothetical protein